jgi:hypothetical protein
MLKARTYLFANVTEWLVEGTTNWMPIRNLQICSSLFPAPGHKLGGNPRPPCGLAFQGVLDASGERAKPTPRVHICPSLVWCNLGRKRREEFGVSTIDGLVQKKLVLDVRRESVRVCHRGEPEEPEFMLTVIQWPTPVQCLCSSVRRLPGLKATWTIPVSGVDFAISLARNTLPTLDWP